jgi:hypothetical protein
METKRVTSPPRRSEERRRTGSVCYKLLSAQDQLLSGILSTTGSSFISPAPEST